MVPAQNRFPVSSEPFELAKNYSFQMTVRTPQEMIFYRPIPSLDYIVKKFLEEEDHQSFRTEKLNRPQ